ncbi:carbohydrate kinase [Candidatus Poribacteria bacterium]|nr:carbohydrate kinase [Candidatus Poribacteria bacterium]
MFSESELTSLLSKFQDLSILVVGDFYLDAYWYIDKTRSTLSLETPWHTNPVTEQSYSPGAAGTVTNNLKALGVGTVYTVGVIGDDNFGRTLFTSLQETGCITDNLIKETEWVTPTYLKPIHRGIEGIETEGPRFDIENSVPFNQRVEDKLIETLQNLVPIVDGVIIGDQMPIENMGVITSNVREELCNLGDKYPEKIIFADSRAHIGYYKNVIIKPNRFEASHAVDPNRDIENVDLSTTKDIALSLSEKTKRTVYITLGENGILVYSNDSFTHILGNETTDKIDPVGAGDSVSAGLVSTLCSLGQDEIVKAAYIGNLVASITVTKIGTTGTASPEEILEKNRSLNGRF